MYVYLVWAAVIIYFFYLIFRVLANDYWALLTVPAGLVYGACVWALYNIAGYYELVFQTMFATSCIFGVWALIGELRTESTMQK